MNKDYDNALADIQSCKMWFDQYLDKQRRVLGCRVSKLPGNKLLSFVTAKVF